MFVGECAVEVQFENPRATVHFVLLSFYGTETEGLPSAGYGRSLARSAVWRWPPARVDLKVTF